MMCVDHRLLAKRQRNGRWKGEVGGEGGEGRVEREGWRGEGVGDGRVEMKGGEGRVERGRGRGV